MFTSIKDQHEVCKEYCLIGLSKFNHQIAKVLHEAGQKVTIVEKSEDIINTISGEFSNEVVLDATNIKDLINLGIDSFDFVIVGMGDIETSITICSNLRELNVKNIMAKSKNYVHERILKYMGISKAIIPETLIADQLAYETMFDLDVQLFSFDSSIKDTFLVRFPVNNKPILNKKICEIEELKQLSSTILSIKRVDGTIIMPVAGEVEVQEADVICVITKKHLIQKLKTLFIGEKSHLTESK